MVDSILIAASPFAVRDPKLGSVLAHACHMARHGGVFWGLIPPGREWLGEFAHPEVKSAYFYDVPTKSVLYRAMVDFAGTPDEFPEKAKYNQYFPDFRGKPEAPVYCLLLTRFEHLDRVYRLRDFHKPDGERVKRVQNYVLVEDPEYPSVFTIP